MPPHQQSHQQYAPKHRAAPVATQPAALSVPRHLGQKRRPARKALRSTVTLTGLAAAATGVAVATGVVQSPSAGVNLADSLSPVSSADKAPTTDVQHRTAVVSRSADRTALSRADRRTDRDPTKAAALGLSSGPAVGGEESLSSADPQAIAEALLPKYGFDSSQMSCLVPLWMGESGWRWNAENASSGAYGIPQSLPGSKMASAGSDWRTNPATQIEWGLGYIRDSYGSPCSAWGFKQSHGWY
ncbi:MAG TPA: lytic transglycosylase domain-containing protein [Nocardioides sp.]|uniref:aggregation-promoting factor C-terminal-like domain-containing protein n=1 Tax=Nocardioides sp. TaxID=35761 RepID=UPI002F42744C